MSDVDVRRLAAIDMYGARGTTRRRRIIVTEFIVAAIGIVALGLWQLSGAHTQLGRIVGVYVILIGVNYVPLVWHAVALSRRGALDAELAGVDTARKLRRYSVLQFWIFLPVSIVVMALRRRS